ncbi:ArsR/SmtB family transcription factor [Brevibacillus thermoruber]|uniref:ArsR/SmtB family transcription factor n=1 Tax=Brevibacillus thermoruber TaxID=33942 RepID=UPI000402106B|nr:metalloregulator ArsR/SmtB family transcription factor [Brevibacillus thermoruber]
MDISIFAALAERNRFHIVELLREGPLTVGEIAARTGLRQPQASKHLRVLSEAGLVTAQADANRRIYKLRPEPFFELEAWVESCRRIWDDRFNQLDDYLNRLQSQSANPDTKE